MENNTLANLTLLEGHPLEDRQLITQTEKAFRLIMNQKHSGKCSVAVVYDDEPSFLVGFSALIEAVQ